MRKDIDKQLVRKSIPLIDKKFSCRFCDFKDSNFTRAKSHLLQSHVNEFENSINDRERSRQKNSHSKCVSQSDFELFRKEMSQKISISVTTRDSMSYIKQLLKQMSAEILNSIAKNLFSVIGAISLSELKNSEHSLRININSIIQGLDFRNVFKDWNSSLSLVEQQIHREHKESTIFTQSRYKKGFQILHQFSYQELYFQINALDHVYSLSQYEIRCFRDCYNRVKQKIPNFNLPDLPKVKKNQQPLENRRKITIQTVQSHVQKCFERSDFTTGVDLWLITCMGLRKSELLKVNIKSDGQFVSAIKIFEQKNRNFTIRIVPDSLCKLARFFSIQFPLSISRFKTVRKYCLVNMGVFYGLRHLCLTNIVRSLYEKTALARFHRSPSTSFNYYIDMESIPLIDSAFAMQGLREKCGTEELRINKIIQIRGNTEKLHDFKREEIKPFNFQYFDLANDDASITNQNREYSRNYQSLQGLIKQEIRFPKIIEQAYEKGNIGVRALINQINSRIQNFIFIEDHDQDNQIPERGKQNQTIQLVLSEQGFKISELSEYSIKEVLMQPQIQTSRQSVNRLCKNPPSCKQCFNILCLSICQQCQGTAVECQICSKKIHECCFGYQSKKGQLEIQQKGRYFKIGQIFRAQLRKQQNNLESKIKNRGFEFLNDQSSYFSEKFPSKFQCYYARGSENLINELCWIQKNQNYLPLSIRESRFGDGVFAESDVPKNAILCTYRGQMKINDETNYKNSDSIWELGWIGEKNIVIDPSSKTNVGRFINCRNSSTQQNCSPFVCITSSRIFVFFMSTKRIRKDQELLYFYGPHYWEKLRK